MNEATAEGGRVNAASPRYLEQNSSQTLKEGLSEYYEVNPGLLEPSELPTAVAQLFRQHDAGHVVFGCDTSLRGEALIDTWTIFGSTAGIKGYVEYFKHPQVNQIFADVGYLRIAVDSAICLPAIFRVVIAGRRLSRPWPWRDYDHYIGDTLGAIRSEFGIRII